MCITISASLPAGGESPDPLQTEVGPWGLGQRAEDGAGARTRMGGDPAGLKVRLRPQKWRIVLLTCPRQAGRRGQVLRKADVTSLGGGEGAEAGVLWEQRGQLLSRETRPEDALGKGHRGFASISR